MELVTVALARGVFVCAVRSVSISQVDCWRLARVRRGTERRAAGWQTWSGFSSNGRDVAEAPPRDDDDAADAFQIQTL